MRYLVRCVTVLIGMALLLIVLLDRCQRQTTPAPPAVPGQR